MNLSATFPRTCHLPSQHFASTLPTNPSSPAHIFTETHAKHDFSHTISFPSSSIPVSDYIPPVRDLDTKPSPMLFRTTQPSPLLEDVGDNVAYGNINPKSPSIFSNATRGTFVTLPRSPTGKPLMYLPARRVTPRKVNNRSLASTQKRNTTHTPESRTPASSHSQRQNSGTPQGASPLSSRSAHVGIIIPPFPSDSDVQQSALTTPQTATHRKVQFADHPQQTKEPYQDLPPQPKTPPILSVLQEQEKAMKNIREDRRKTPQRERRRADREHDESSSDSASDWEQPNPYCMLIEEVVSVEPPSYYQRDTRTNRELREREKMRRFAGKQAEKEWDDEEGLERELDPDSDHKVNQNHPLLRSLFLLRLHPRFI
ncbi:hypothetical protein BLNAU_13884 [Blattamonas nauphoetae]|uniref:Uncharacterized protein n=1 Tax=Blattamonas nauphoetae TaxID=2049346 RepID=A0ABQ9XLM2_9EUKA|nr:hypothetical protein BLNAU_13884 [Blattamonas nauphoetae]